MSSTALSITQAILDYFGPCYVTVDDVSHRHANHFPAAKKALTHAVIMIVSPVFQGMTRVQRHQKIWPVLQSFWDTTPLHSVQLKTYTPCEYTP